MSVSSDEANKLREERKPSHVNLGNAPRWLLRRITRRFGGKQYNALYHTLPCAINPEFGHSVLDHWGSTILTDGSKAFVTEPYATKERLASVMSWIASEIGCEWCVSDNSEWYPPGTIRGMLYESVDSKPLNEISRASSQHG